MMKHFRHAVWLSFKYKWSIAGSVLTSLVIAFLFCISISTVFPVIKIVLEGETAPQWVANEIAKAENESTNLNTQIAKLETEQNNATNEVEKKKTTKAIESKKNRLNAEQEALARYEWLKGYVDKYAPTDPFTTLVVAMVFLLLTAIAKGVMLILSTVLVSRISQRTILDMRRIYYRKALEMDQRKIEQIGTSMMMTQLSNNMNMVSGGLRGLYGKSLREPFKMICCLVSAAMISLPLLLVSMLVVPAGAFAIQSLARRMKKAVQSELGGIAEVFQTLIETLSWLKTVRMFNREGTERRRFKHNAGIMYNMSMRIAIYDSLLRPITEVLGIISIACSILAGSYLVLNKTTMLFGFQILERPLEPGMLILFYGLLAGASDPARKMSEIINVLVRGDTACQNLKNTFATNDKPVPVADRIPVPAHAESIEFRNVSFQYKQGKPVLDEVNLKVPFGQTVAIVGGNGCGKSTLMNLLARFYDPQGGQLTIDGANTRLMNPKRLRRQIAWVTQESVLFRGTVAENIGYGDKHATRTEILSAARAAHVTDFLPKLENGLDTNIGDNGVQLSAGQRQRVALARAILADPRILILDEATSQMDGNTERLIHESLKRFLKNRTTFIVTHRASTLELADRIIVMENGRIVSDDDATKTIQQSEHFQFLFAKSA